MLLALDTNQDYKVLEEKISHKSGKSIMGLGRNAHW